MDTGIIDLAFKAVLALAQLALFVYVRNTNRNDEVDRRFVHVQTVQEEQSKELSTSVGHLSQRLAHLEAAIEAAPDHNDLSKVYQSINELSEKVDTLVGSFDTQSATLRQILSRVIERGMP